MFIAIIVFMDTDQEKPVDFSPGIRRSWIHETRSGVRIGEFGEAAASEAAHWRLLKPLDRAQELCGVSCLGPLDPYTPTKFRAATEARPEKSAL
jgi:hypothetical protein